MCIILAILIKLSIRGADPQRDFLTLTLTLPLSLHLSLCLSLASSPAFSLSCFLSVSLLIYCFAHLLAAIFLRTFICSSFIFFPPPPFPLSPCLVVVVVVRYCCCCCPLLLSLRVLHKCNFFILTAHCAPQSFRFRFRLHSRPVTATPPPLSLPI